MAGKLLETDLYAPIKTMLEAKGYDVKAEVGRADIVAMREGEPPVIIELKTAFSLTLIHQAIERLKITDSVYVAIPEWKGRSGWKAFRANRTLCRRLGLGLITVSPNNEKADIHLDPGPYAPRKSKKKQTQLSKEFSGRVGDPNLGGSTKVKLVTAYRQDALRCLQFLNLQGPTKAALVAKATQVSRARTIMASDHYGWFTRVDKGIYAITPIGQNAIDEYRQELERLA